jgi:hypothetical protein
MAARSFAQETTKQSFLEESAYLRVSSPLFSALARACADDEDIADLCAVARPGQPVGSLFLCAGQYLLFKSPSSPAARYFPSLTPTPAPADQAFPAFREFCLDQRAELAQLLASRTVNTNLVEKASGLLPAVQYVSDRTGQPLTMLEICCSAGMNLMFDQYHYDYGSHGQVGAQDSPVRLQCKILGAAQPPVHSMPAIADRIGVDLVKMDPALPADRLWMEAVLYPEWTQERERLRAALEVRVARGLRTVIGDAIEVVPGLLEELPGPLCVLLSHCLGQWPPASRIALEDMLRNASRHREIHRLDIELIHDEPPQSIRERLVKLASAGIPIVSKSFPSRIEHTKYADGEVARRLLGYGDSFGVWLDWR